MTEGWPFPPFVFQIVGYMFVLVAALMAVNVTLHRLTRRERGDTRPRRRDDRAR